MTTGLMSALAMAMVFLTPVVLGTSHLSFNSSLAVNISRSGCGMTKLCVEDPDDCDPAGGSACLFFSVDATGPSPPNGFDLAVQLRGDSAGYVAMALTANATMGTSMVFLCGQNSSVFFFRTADRNNSQGGFSPNERRVRDIRGSVNGSVIQCEFTIPMVNASSRSYFQSRDSHFSSFVVQLGTGPVTAGVPGAFSVSVTTPRLNLNDPTSNIAANMTTMAPMTAGPTMAPMTGMPMTTSDGLALRSQAVLFLLGALVFLLA